MAELFQCVLDNTELEWFRLRLRSGSLILSHSPLLEPALELLTQQQDQKAEHGVEDSSSLRIKHLAASVAKLTEMGFWATIFCSKGSKIDCLIKSTDQGSGCTRNQLGQRMGGLSPAF